MGERSHLARSPRSRTLPREVGSGAVRSSNHIVRGDSSGPGTGTSARPRSGGHIGSAAPRVAVRADSRSPSVGIPGRRGGRNRRDDRARPADAGRRDPRPLREDRGSRADSRAGRRPRADPRAGRCRRAAGLGDARVGAAGAARRRERQPRRRRGDRSQRRRRARACSRMSRGAIVVVQRAVTRVRARRQRGADLGAHQPRDQRPAPGEPRRAAFAARCAAAAGMWRSRSPTVAPAYPSPSGSRLSIRFMQGAGARAAQGSGWGSSARRPAPARRRDRRRRRARRRCGVHARRCREARLADAARRRRRRAGSPPELVAPGRGVVEPLIQAAARPRVRSGAMLPRSRPPPLAAFFRTRIRCRHPRPATSDTPATGSPTPSAAAASTSSCCCTACCCSKRMHRALARELERPRMRVVVARPARARRVRQAGRHDAALDAALRRAGDRAARPPGRRRGGLPRHVARRQHDARGGRRSRRSASAAWCIEMPVLDNAIIATGVAFLPVDDRDALRCAGHEG